jgi:hypothetical protein
MFDGTGAETDPHVTADELGTPVAELLARREARKRPSCDRLSPGVATLDDGTRLPLFNTGDRVIVERMASCLAGHPWLDTVVGRVKSIDDETGHVVLEDEDSDPRLPARCHRSFTSGLHVFWLAAAKGNPFAAPKTIQVPRQGEQKATGAAKGRRGRPKGSKNRPKAIVAAEKQDRNVRRRGRRNKKEATK